MKLKLNENIKTETYKVGNKFMVDIVETPKDYEAYIYMKDYAIKELMFGCPKSQQSKDYFIQLVETDLEFSATLYTKNYVDQE